MHIFKIPLLIIISFTIHKSSIAQTTSDPFLNNIPKDSLTFMVYGNTSLMTYEVKEKLNESLPYILQDIISETNKFCIYSQKNELYDSYTLKFNLAQNNTNLNTDSLLKTLGFSIDQVQLPFIKLDGGNFKKGLFYINNSEFTLKIYTQILPINEAIRNEYKEISTKLNFANYDEKRILWERIDSISKSDSTYSNKFFSSLLEEEKTKLTNDYKTESYNIHSIFNADLKQSTAIVYLNAKKIHEIPFHFYNVFKTDIYNINDFVNKLAGIAGYYEDIWVNIKTDQEKLNITSIASLPKKQKLHQKLDKEICTYLPSQKYAGLCIFNMKPAEIKNSMIKYFNLSEYNDKKLITSKFAVWAIDDDVINSLGNGFISIFDGEYNRHDIPDFKMALKMSDKKTANQLLNILTNDAKALSKIKDNCYLVIYDKLYEKKKVNLVIEDDIWILGTQSFDELRSKIKQDNIATLYPKLNNKTISQYLYLNTKVFSSSKIDLEFIESESSFYGKNKIKTETSLIIK